MSYCIYLRKSRADAQLEAMGQGETLQRHRAALLDLAKQRKLLIGEIYEEIVSGDTIAARPQMQRLLQDVQDGNWEGVLVMEIERLARGDTIDQGVVAQTFKYSDTLIITPMKTYDPKNESDEEFFEFSLFMARREYKAIKRRLQAGRLASVREGKYQSPRAPYGYRRVKLQGEKGWTLEPVEPEASIVRMCFDLYLNGENGQNMGTGLIARRLNAMGIITPLGNPWTRNRIQSMLQNPTYIGKVQWYMRESTVTMENGVRKVTRPKSEKHMLINGLHPAIINEDDFAAVQDIFRTHKKPNTSGDLVNPLGGLLVCPFCGKRMQLVRPGYGDQEKFYRCMTFDCPTFSSQASVVENAVLSALKGWVEKYELSSPIPSFTKPDESTEEIALIEKQLTTLKAQLDRARELLERDVYSIDVYVEREKEIKSRIAEAQSVLKDIKGAMKEPSSQEQMQSIIPRVVKVLDAYGKASSAEEKNKLLKSVISKIVYHKTKRGYRNSDLGSLLTLEVFPRFKI